VERTEHWYNWKELEKINDYISHPSPSKEIHERRLFPHIPYDNSIPYFMCSVLY
jgi:hypothetical protein